MRPESSAAGTPTSVPVTDVLPYIGWLPRLGARVADTLVLVPTYLVFLFGSQLAERSGAAVVVGIVSAIIGAVASIGLLVWNEVFRFGRTGSSIGRELAGYSVLDLSTQEPIGAGRAVARYFAHVLDAVPLLLGFLWPLWDDKRQTFADKIVSTVAVAGAPGEVRETVAAAQAAAESRIAAVADVSSASTAGTLLEVRGLCVNYGHIEAIRDISFGVEEGTIATLIGANGAGKTTTLKTISGLRKVRAGQILLDGKDITYLPPYERVLLGLSQSPEGRGCFPGMTVLENLDMGAFVRRDRKTAAYRSDLDRVFDLFPRLKERERQAAGSMSGGEQQMLAIGRALMAKPRLVLLDEPSMGLAPKLIQQIFSIITEINNQGTTVLLVEQNAAQALKRAHTAHVLETGEIVRSGTGAELAVDDSVKAAYLGGDV
ncbi:ATP-binding cassette domain-containing protein [Nocardioides marmoriginsengisoli]|uniref:ATP-binding cassette domain-containing protein n=1 Tax=Nocardioides marmoriginsengisoli TaxID=661483 RepID=A0A3N0CNR2_9ACTN|nr:ATP-binding cassette domain-containing protein [Nocardioides marmoriginsengisoli]